MSEISLGRFYDRSRSRRILDELNFALKNSSTNELRGWALGIPSTAGTVAIRRGVSLVLTAKSAGRFLVGELSNAATAFRGGALKQHLLSTGRRAGKFSSESAAGLSKFVSALSAALVANPREEAPKLVAFVLGAGIGGGGIDGDGGIPDLDFLGGIGAHRSIFTHSIIAPVVLETLTLATSDLVKMVYNHLPADHDGFWDEIEKQRDASLTALHKGMSLGVAYHLGIDGSLDAAGTYKDLPISVGHTGHNFVLWTNALAEGNDAVQRDKRSDRRKCSGETSGAASRQTGATPHPESISAHPKTARKPSEPHKAFLDQKSFGVRPDEADMFTEEELTIVRRYGAWMEALDTGTIIPESSEQEEFVAACRTNREPKSKFERAWLKLRERRRATERGVSQ